MVGWKFSNTGATAWGLLNENSRTGAGVGIKKILDSEPGQKDVLLCFGEVDVVDHIGKHGTPEDESLRQTVDRYMQFCREILDRPDTGVVLVTSTIPHSKIFRGSDHDRLRSLSERWNALVMTGCDANGLTYVDWYDCIDGAFGSPRDGNVEDIGEHDPTSPNERHMSDAVRPVLLAQVRAALLRLDS